MWGRICCDNVSRADAFHLMRLWMGSATHSCVHWLRTKRKVIDDFPHPPSPHTVMEILCASFMLYSLFPSLLSSSTP